MRDTVADLAERGRALTPEDRARLVELLLQSLEAPDAAVEDAWRAELRHRVEAYERGEAVLHEADDVIAEAERLTR